MPFGISINSCAYSVLGTPVPNSAHCHLSEQQKHEIVKLEFPDFFQLKIPSGPLPVVGFLCPLGTQHHIVEPI